MEMEAATKQHQWLQQLVGEWSFEGEAIMGPDKPAERSKGYETVRALGEFWVLGEGEGEMPGGGLATMLITLGYDPAKGSFVGTWVGSMMPTLWVYEGRLDPAEKVLTLSAEGPSFTGDGKIAQYQDVITLESEDHRTLHSQVQGEDGTWTRFMTAHYRRVR
jgi:hypothetical protein